MRARLPACLLAIALGACEKPAPPAPAAAPAEAAAAAPAPADPGLAVAAAPAPAQADAALAAGASGAAPAAASPPAPAPGAAPPAAEPPPAAPAEPPPASAAPLLVAASAAEPAGPARLSLDAETVVDPAASFAVELAARIPDARLVLLDAADAHVPAAQAREVGATTRFSLAPAAPLVPGSRYVLRVEGAAGREMRDAGGGALAPLSFAVLAAGTPPPPEPKRRTRRRR